MDQGAEYTRTRKWRDNTMNTKTILKGVFLAFCLIGMLVLPVAAAPAGQVVGQGMMNGKANSIDAGLKEDLWNSHMQYRLEAFDMHVQHGTDVIKILNDHNIDTTQMQVTLTTFSGKRSELVTALENQDKDALQKINAELKQLRQDFIKEMRDTIREHYSAVKAVAKTTTTGTISTAAITGSSDGIAAL
jgi:hypothetical protein